MKRSIFLLTMACLVGLALGGCGGKSLLPVEGQDAVDVVRVAGDRFGYWYLAVKEQAEAKKAESNARAEEAKAQQAAFNGFGDKGWDLSRVESQAMYVMHQSNQIMAATMREMAQVMSAMTGHVADAYTPMPKGAFSEGIEATFTGLANVGNSTGVKILTTGISGKWILDALGGWQGHRFSTEGGDLTISDSLTRSDVGMSGSEDGLINFGNPSTTTTTTTTGMPEMF